ncbi:palmitoyltransferase ZDHHC20-B-like isoform X1 [Petromyzon marinus]|uniref:Palmitoyltransferase n=1 Tax=Petromyzon marinus TaxID=7757 RepID=A0AAJ7UBR9_PETMA|nr:palmitoyltransferase ZDHHC2-like isoform X1 [Petromyzon marinus]XP_032832830.1 palmitoyltransferase ZDHHC2-like isoform X1 [Petromyzon marinus]
MAPYPALRCCVRVVNWVPVVFIVLVVCWSYFAYVVELCVFTVQNVGEKVVYLLLFHVLFAVLVWSYWKTIFTEPQGPSAEFSLPYTERELLEREGREDGRHEILQRAAASLPLHTRTLAGAIRYCEKCNLIKPDRCHHCSTCEACILKMDHHCPWVNNCVGFANYKFFVLFLAYSLLYCVYVSATVLQYFLMFWRVSTRSALPDDQAKFHVLFLFFAGVIFGVSVVSLFGYHCWLVCKNRSTLEAFRAPIFRHGPDKNGFNLGVRKNVEQVFGDQARYWILPVPSSLGDGCSFPTCLVPADVETGGSITSPALSGNGHPEPAGCPYEPQSHLLMSGGEQAWGERAHSDARKPIMDVEQD